MTRADMLCLVSLFCMSLASTSSSQAPMQSHEQFVCTSGPVRKIIRIYNGTTLHGERTRGSCRVDYTKNGKTTTLWSSNSDHYCTTKALSLVTKLIQGNYSCKPQSMGLPEAIDPAAPQG